jgi:hypothetical protein
MMSDKLGRLLPVAAALACGYQYPQANIAR